MVTTETNISVRYPEVDAMGIVHHGVYPLWYEMGRMDWCAAHGFSFAEMQTMGLNPTLVSLNLTYKAPVTYPGMVTVRTWCRAFGPRKLELAYETVGVDGTVVNTATSFHIWTGPGNKTADLSLVCPEIYQRFRTCTGEAYETL